MDSQSVYILSVFYSSETWEEIEKRWSSSYKSFQERSVRALRESIKTNTHVIELAQLLSFIFFLNIFEHLL